jgi:predicted Zn-dependent peptidase
MDCGIKKRFKTQFRILIFSFVSFTHNFFTQTNLNYSYALHDPWGVRIYTLKNGLTVFLCPDTISNEIAGMIVVKAGSAQDPNNATGLAHYLEHMLFKGTTDLGTVNYEKEKVFLEKIKELFEKHRNEPDPLKAKKIYKEIDSISFLASKFSIPNEYDKLIQSLGSKEYNAMTANDATVYYTLFPSNQLEKWLTIESERFKNPVFRLFHTELEAVYEEKNITLSSDTEKSWDSIASKLFAPTPYSYKTTIGTIEHLKKPSIVEIENYFKKYYVANNMGLILCGKFNPDKAIFLIENLFSSFPKVEFDDEPWPELLPLKSPYEKITLIGKEKESLEFCWRVPVKKEKEYLMLYFLSEILHKNQKGLLYDKFVKNGYALSVETYYHSLVKHAVFGISFQPGTLNAEQIHDTLIQFLNTIQPHQFKQQEIKNLINNFKKDFYYHDDNPLSKAMLLQNLFIHSISWQDYLNRIKSMDTITSVGILNVFRKYIQHKPYVLVHKIQSDSIEFPKVEKPEITPISGQFNAQSSLYKKIQSMPVPTMPPPKYVPGKNYYYSAVGKTSFYSCPNTKKNITEIKLIYHNTGFEAFEGFIPLLLQNACPSQSTTEQTKDFMNENSLYINSYYSSLGLEIVIDFLTEKKTEVFNFLNKFLNESRLEEKNFKRILKEYQNNFNEPSANNQFEKLCRHSLKNMGVYKEKKIQPEILQKLKPDTFNIFFQNLNKPDAVLFAGNLSDTAFIKKICFNRESPLRIEYGTKQLHRDTHFVFLTTNPQSLLNVYSLIPFVQQNFKDLYPQITLFNNFMPFIMYKRIRENKGLAYSTTGHIKYIVNKNTLYLYHEFFIGTQYDKTCDAIKEFQSIIKTFPLNPKEFENNKISYYNHITANSKKNLDLLNNLYLYQILKLTPNEFNVLPEKIKQLTYPSALNFYKKYIAQSAKSYVLLTDQNCKFQNCINPRSTKLLDINQLN